jgi:uncharacterized membrane protein YeiH
MSLLHDRAVRLYHLEMLGTAVFAATGVLVVTRRGLDIFGALVLGLVTALGGGTVRDVMIQAPVFWLADVSYVWVALLGALGVFWIAPRLRSTYLALLYLDALGAALFAVSATNKVLLLGLPAAVAVTMGMLTGIGGGLLRDVLAGRPTLLMSREIYATPILLGCSVFAGLRQAALDLPPAALIGIAVIFGIRALAIHRGLEMPAWLTQHPDDPG